MKNISRKNCAVMFTDIVDSTKRYSLKGDDVALESVIIHFDLLKPLVFEFKGIIIKTIGDSIMATFDSPQQAVNSAVKMQRILNDYNSKHPDDKIEIRIAIHYGKVNEKTKDIFGDTVNTAARIESLAAGRTIFVSEIISKMIDGYESIFIGDFDVKGKLEPITVFGIIWESNSRSLLDYYRSVIKSLIKKANRTKTEKNRQLGIVGRTGDVGVMALFEVKSNPAGATVSINKKTIEHKTPLAIEYRVGHIDLEIVKEGFRSIKDSFEIFEHLPNKFYCELEDIRSSLIIETDSPGYEIYLDGKFYKAQTTPCKIEKILPGEYIIRLLSREKFSKPEKVSIPEKTEYFYRAKLINYSKIVIISKYNKNILLVRRVDNEFGGSRRLIKYIPTHQYVKDISQVLKLEPGKYEIISEKYSALSMTFNVGSQNFKIIDFDEFLSKREINLHCGKFDTQVMVEYKNRSDYLKVKGKGDISRDVYPSYSLLCIKNKYLKIEKEYNFFENNFELDISSLSKRSRNKKLLLSISKFILAVILALSLIYLIFQLTPRISSLNLKGKFDIYYSDLKQYVSSIYQSNNNIVEDEKSEGEISVRCTAVNSMIVLKNDTARFSLSANKRRIVKIGSYDIEVIAKGYLPYNKKITILKDQKLEIEPRLEPIQKTTGDLKFVEGGYFTFLKHVSSEEDKKEVFINDFYISKLEVTQEQWKEIMDYNNSLYRGAKLPVENITWLEAVKFCNAKSIQDGYTPCYAISDKGVKCNFNLNGYRLPTEAEWEYAARGGRRTQNYLYAGSNVIDLVAWYRNNSGNMTKPVGLKQANELGLFDMSGNVWEWCWDWYGKLYEQPIYNPRGPKSGELKIRRQGSWSHSKEHCEIGYREVSSPSIKSGSIGFRYVRTKL